MGANFISEKISFCNGVRKMNVISESLFSFEYSLDGITYNEYKVYMPTRDDYEVSIEVVDRAINKGANYIIYDTWIFPNGSGRSYAESRNVKVFPWSEFVQKVRKREQL